MKKILKKYKKNERAKEILECVAKIGFILTLMITVPNAAGHIMKLLGMVPDYRAKTRIKRSLNTLEKRGLIKYKKGKNGYFFLEITTKGKSYWLRENIRKFKLIKGKKWDGFWRIITFDIPEEKSNFRRKLSRALQFIGMYNLEKSIYIYPYKCKENVLKVAEAYEVREYVRFIIAKEIERDEGAKKFFKI
ncbi:MAG: hypothetical protein JW740_01430 [Candidatus Zambryskibacteria bacterium]|nr:hypothetical protein [Candidatus Zambryskibacteria bacterium]